MNEKETKIGITFNHIDLPITIENVLEERDNLIREVEQKPISLEVAAHQIAAKEQLAKFKHIYEALEKQVARKPTEKIVRVGCSLVWTLECFNCGYEVSGYEKNPNYCPNCGGKIDKEVTL